MDTKDRGFAIEVYEYRRDGVFFFKEMTRIFRRNGRQLKTRHILEHFLEITNTTRYSNNFFYWANCPTFCRRSEQLFGLADTAVQHLLVRKIKKIIFCVNKGI